MFRFLHAADIHLDSPLRGLAQYEGAPIEVLRGATRRALENLVRLAIDEEAAFVLLAGDLYDGDWKDYNTGLYLVRQLVRLKEAGIEVFLVSGNHDASSRITRHLSLPENTHRFSARRPETYGLEVDTDEVAIHGQGYGSQSVTDDLASAYPQARPGCFNIGLLHTSLTGRPGHASYAPCTLDTLRSKGYDYWALGHVHQREVVSQDPWVVFPGNLQGRHARELGSKGCTLVTVSEGKVQEAVHCELDVLRWARCEVDAAGATTVEEVVSRAREALALERDGLAGQVLAARIVVQGPTQAHEALRTQPEAFRAELLAATMDLAGDDIWLEKVQLRTRGLVDLEAVAAREDAVGSLVRALQVLDDDRLSELTRALSDLDARLPEPLRTGEERLDLRSPEGIRPLVEDARELLLAELLDQGGAR